MGDTPANIPHSKLATQIPPPTGGIQRLMYRIFGPSYRTGIAGVLSGLPIVIGGIVAGCPKFMETGKFNRHEFFVFGMSFIAGGGISKLGWSAKDKSVSGVEA